MTAPHTAWDPVLYQRFRAERLRPGLDLLAGITASDPRRVVDLGCGTGGLTAALQARWPKAAITGIDSSPEMLSEARSMGGIAWEEASIDRWTPDEPIDVIFSNAALHWLGGHAALFPRLLGFLSPGGSLGVQMPLSWHEPSHLLMRETLRDLGLGSPALLERIGTPPVAEPSWYHRLFAARGTEVDVWSTTYLQALSGEDAVLAWVSGSALRPVLDDLAAEDGERFVAEYGKRLASAYPPEPDGSTLLPFPRLFIVAVR